MNSQLAQPGQVDFEATRGPLRHAAPANATPRRFILNKRIRTQQSPLHTSATHATVDPSDPEPPDLDGLSLYDQAAVGSNGNRRGAAQDDMNDEERAIWMLGRDLRDQLRVEGELE